MDHRVTALRAGPVMTMCYFAAVKLLHQPNGLYHDRHTRLLLGEELGELIRRHIGVVPALLLEDVLPRGRLHQLFDQLAERLLLRVIDAGRAEPRAPVGENEIDTLFLEGWNVGAR